MKIELVMGSREFITLLSDIFMLEFFYNKKISKYFITYCMGVHCTHGMAHTQRSEAAWLARAASFIPPLGLGIKSRSPGLVAIIFSCWAIFQNQKNHLWNNVIKKEKSIEQHI